MLSDTQKLVDSWGKYDKVGCHSFIWGQVEVEVLDQCLPYTQTQRAE